MDPAVESLIAAIHRAPIQAAFALTGGGSGAIAWLLGVPGGSRTVLEAVVPYAEHALTEYIGHRPEQFCSTETGLALAGRAYERARRLAPGTEVIGVGCTAGLATDRPKRGDHRFHVAVHTSAGTATYDLTLSKGARDRAGEEEVLDRVLLNALAEAVGVTDRIEEKRLPGETVEISRRTHEGGVERFLNGSEEAICVEPDGLVPARPTLPSAILPGSFNPLHVGHLGLADAAARRLGLPIAFELSVANVDKPALSAAVIRQRIEQFRWKLPVWLTRAPTFVEKAALFRGCVFVVGADTAARIVDARYYAGGGVGLAEARSALQAAGCRFLVAGRIDSHGQLLGLEHLNLPTAWSPLFEAIPASEFRLDVSSTELRRQG